VSRNKNGTYKKGHSTPSNVLKPEFKSIRMALKEHVAKTAGELLTPMDEITTRLENNPTALEYIFYNAIKSKDYKTIENFLDRVIGKPKTIINQKLSIKDLSDEKLEEMAKRVVLDGELDE